MIRELLYEFYTVFRRFTGSGAVLVLFFAAVLALTLFSAKKNGRIKGPVALSVLGTIATALTETVDFVFKDTRFRPALKYAATAFAVCIAALVIAASGKSVFSEEFNTRAENDLHIPGGIEAAMEDILNDADTPVVIAMPGWNEYFESYSSGFEMIKSEILLTELEKTSPDMKKVASVAGKHGCKYIVLSDDIWPEVPLTKCGYDVFCEHEGCRVYKEVSAP